MKTVLSSKKPVTKSRAETLYFNALKSALDKYIAKPSSIKLHRESSGKVNFQSHNILSSTPVMFLRDYGKSIEITLLLSFTPNDQNEYLINPNCPKFQDHIFNARQDWDNDLKAIFAPCFMTNIGNKPFVALKFEKAQFDKAFDTLRIVEDKVKENELFKKAMIFFVVKYLKRAQPRLNVETYDKLENPLAYNFRRRFHWYLVDREVKKKLKAEKIRAQKRANERNYK
ncbi:hypothetical protein [Vibrio cyclitrophicus]|uniref:hypothetical protein n=1 Tax=Vibrio cyclitrophicus TaxID=47951 RepID=UPI0032E3A091